MADPAEAMYPGGTKNGLGNEMKFADRFEPAQPQQAASNAHRQMLKQIVETGMKGLGFSGGAMGIAQDLLDAFDHGKILSPMKRLEEYRNKRNAEESKQAVE
jgi:hypothetical protein